MATDDSRARLYNKKILPIDAFREGLSDYLRGEIHRVLEFNFSQPVILSSVPIPITPSTNPNAIDIGVAPPPVGTSWQATTGTGFIIKFLFGDTRFQNIRIPSDHGVYSVALEACEVEDGVELNPRTAQLEYRSIIESVGRKREPDQVAISGSDLVVTVDSVFDAVNGAPNGDHTGRKVRVWLKSTEDEGPGPATAVESDAFQVGTVTFAGGRNQITVPALGQATPSTVVTDYWIQAIGPTVKQKAIEDLSLTLGAVLLGEVTGVASGALQVPGNIVTAGQRLIAFTLSDLSDVLRRDVHGRIKVAVKVDPNDVGSDPQFSILSTTGVEKASINSNADLALSGNATVNGMVLSKTERSKTISLPWMMWQPVGTTWTCESGKIGGQQDCWRATTTVNAYLYCPIPLVFSSVSGTNVKVTGAKFWIEPAALGLWLFMGVHGYGPGTDDYKSTYDYKESGPHNAGFKTITLLADDPFAFKDTGLEPVPFMYLMAQGTTVNDRVYGAVVTFTACVF